jgi:hypothetical protein
MKKALKIIIIIFIYSCSGGGIGNIQIYEFNTSSVSLKRSIDKLYESHLIMKPKPTIQYTYYDDNDSENCLLIYKNDSIIFNYEISNVVNQPSKSLLIILGCGKYGEVIELPSYISEDSAEYYRKIFTEQIVNKLPFSFDTFR